MILLTSLLDILSKDKSLFNIINFLIVVTLGTVTVVFKGLLLQNYLYLLIGLLSLGIIDSTIGLIKVTKYKKKKINQDNEDKKDNKSIKKNTKKRKK